MSEYDEDERELEDVPPEEPAGHAQVKFNVPMPTVEQVTGEIARQLISRADYKSMQQINAVVQDRIERLIDERVASRVTPIIEELLERPMQPTDGYGQPVGEPTTVAGVIRSHVEGWALTTVDQAGVVGRGSGYDKDKYHPRINWALGQIVSHEMKKSVTAEIEKIKATLKTSATASIAKQIAEQVSTMVLK